MMKMIVVIGESGEYEQRYETLFGAFDTMEIAEREVARAIAESRGKWDLYHAWDERRKSILAALPPVQVLKDPFFHNGEHRSYSTEQYATAEREAGAKPSFGFLSDTVYFHEVSLNVMCDAGSDAIREVEVERKGDHLTCLILGIAEPA